MGGKAALPHQQIEQEFADLAVAPSERRDAQQMMQCEDARSGRERGPALNDLSNSLCAK
jgi:hypothetical protein